MGYYTRYSLEVHAADTSGADDVRQGQLIDKKLYEYQLIVDAIAAESGYSHPFEGDIKWYDYVKDMSNISKRFPDLIFTLSGEGEESGDIWKRYFYRGDDQYAAAKVTFAPFDHKALS